MKKLLLCAVAVLGVAASIFGGYYYFANDAAQETEVPQVQQSEIEKEEVGATCPECAEKWRADAWRDENGVVFTDGLARAVAQRDAYLEAHAHADGFGDNGIARMNWRPIGPMNVGGRTRSVVIDRNHPIPQTIWAGAVSGGVWRSDNDGKSWVATNNKLQNFSVNCMVIDYLPNGSRRPTLWAGTGEGFVTNGLAGGGLFKSTDGGVSWTRVLQSYQMNWQYIDSLAITHWFNPNTQQNETVMLAGVEGPVSTNHGIMRSTDGGTNWAQAEPNNPDVNGFTSYSIVVDPNNPGHIVAEVRSPAIAPNSNRVIYSTDAGEHWTAAKRNGATFETNRADRIVKLLYFKGNTNIVYAQAVGDGPFEPSTISKSEDGGKNYNIQLGGVPTYSDYKSLFWLSPNDASLMITGGTSIYLSSNGGTSFTMLITGQGLGNTPHDDSQYSTNSTIQGEENKVYVTNDGGIYRTNDIRMMPTPVWQQLNSTYQTTQFFTAAGDSNSGLISGGTQDQGALRLIAGDQDAAKWSYGDGGGSAVDGTYCYGQVNGNLQRTSDCGSTNPFAEGIYDGINDYLFNPIAVPWVASMKVDQTNPDRFFFGASSVWRSDNIKAIPRPTWYEIKANPTMTASPSGSPYKPVQITAMDVHPTHPEIMWVAETEASSFGRLYKTANATANPGSAVTWTPVEDNTPGHDWLPNRNISKILIDSSDQSYKTVYVGLGTGYLDAEKSLYKTNDGGTSWTDVTGDDVACQASQTSIGLPCVPVNAIAIDPYNSAKIYAGTDIGLYVTENVNAVPVRWSPIMNGPANVKISDLNYLKDTTGTPNKLLAATYGRGLWVADLNPEIVVAHAVNDFDGDGRSDLAVVRQDSTHKVWHVQGSTEAYRAQEFGNRDDQAAAADYDGDGKTDVAVYRGSEQKFYCMRSSDNTVAVTQIAQPNEIAMTTSADFDGDDLADEAVFEPYTGDWHVEQSGGGRIDFHWGAAGDVAVAMDFSGDGAADFGVYHEDNGMITLSYYSNGAAHSKQFGLEGDIPVPGDYDGDGKMDVAVWRPDDDGEGNGCWYITYAANSFEGFDSIPWGESGDVPVPGDYDGDGKLDIAVFRPSTGMWHILESSNGYYSERFGADGDLPVGIKALAQASRPGSQSFTRAPSWAEPKRRSLNKDKTNAALAD